MAPSRVRKRDGREAPFDARKIEAAVAKAMAAVGEEDPTFAAEIAGVVTLTIDNRYPESSVPNAAHALPEIEEIQDLVERALIELGRVNVAKTYILYRDRRARAREALAVHDSGVGAQRRSRIEVQTPERSMAWSKGRIAAALINEAHVSRETAERVASNVEERVFGAGLKRITTALVRELVDNELVSLGLSAALRRQVAYGLPSYDLRSLLGSGPAPLDAMHAAAGESLAERRVDSRVSAEVLRRFAPDEALSFESASAHLSGDLHLVDLAAPHVPLVLGVPASLVAHGDGGPQALFELLEELVEFAHETAYGLVLEDFAPLFAPLVGATRGAAPNSLLGAWLRAAAAAANGAGRRIDLSWRGAGVRSAGVCEALVRELADRSLGACAPRLFLDNSDLHALLDGAHGDATFVQAVEDALLAGRLVPTWGDGARRCVGPGLIRGEGERAAIACAGAAAINLPRIALRAGPWREDRAMELLSNACSAAIDGLAELGEFQQRVRSSRLGVVRGRPHFALAPVGLREMLAYLGDGEIRPDQGARMLGFLGDAARRYGDARKLAVDVDPYFAERARVRFARLDAELPQHAQRLLFGDGVGAGVDPRAPYTAGWRLSPAPGRALWEAEAIAVSTLAASALHPLPEERSRGGRASVVESWRRFDRMRRREDLDDRDDRHEPASPSASSSDAELFRGAAEPELPLAPDAPHRPTRSARGA